MIKKNLFHLIIISLSIFYIDVMAASYLLEDKKDSLIGKLVTVRSVYEDTLLDIARKNGLGYHEIKMLNPNIDVWLPGEGSEILLPSQFLLPHAPRNGIVLNIPEMRLYYYPDERNDGSLTVFTYPLGIGRQGWDTPYVDTKIIQKRKDPSWHPPESIRKEHEANGDPLPKRVGPGPNNPLGKFAMRLGLPAYLIHGTNKPSGIGMRVSHGCIRLYPEDIEELFAQVDLKTPVHIINQPYKLGQHQGEIYLEAHPFLEEDADQFRDNLTSVVSILIDLTGDNDYEVDWQLAKQVIREMKGIPVHIGSFTHPSTQSLAAVDSMDNGVKLRLDMVLKSTGQ